MAEEQVEGLPEELREWVHDRAAATDRDPGEVLARSIAAYRFLEGESDGLVAADGRQDGPVVYEGEDAVERLEAFEEELAALEERLDGVESEFDEKVQDVRERVIQVKREADAKAPAEHDHEELREEITHTMEVARESGEAAAEVREELSALREEVDEGFDNFEDVLEYLTDATDDLEEKAAILAQVAIGLRARVSELEGADAAREATAELTAKANREGIEKAVCESCDTTVRLGLLTAPQCPECETTFTDVEPSSGFFGSPKLRTGSRPALESGEDGTPDSPAELFEDVEPGEDDERE